MARLFVEQLTVIDAAILDAEQGLLGESWIVDVELEGELDRQGMVLDFSRVKREIKRLIDDEVDHRLLVPLDLPGLDLEARGRRLSLTSPSPRGLIRHESPANAVRQIAGVRIDATSLSQHLQTCLLAALPRRIQGLGIHLRHERIAGASYRYAHGLKKHNGPCQRIAHGHRSRIELRVGGLRSTELEAAWSRRWAGRYLGSREDLVSRRGGRLRFAYRSGEGRFALELPAECCELLPCDTTVEHLAAFIAKTLARAQPGETIEVRAYEGVMKGAIARAPQRRSRSV